MGTAGFDKLNALKKKSDSTTTVGSQQFDINQYRNKNNKLLKAALAFLGIAVAAEIINALTMDKDNQIREMQSQVLVDAQVAEKDWICYGNDPCPFCLEMQKGNPYPVSFSVDSHPHCQCDWAVKGE